MKKISLVLLTSFGILICFSMLPAQSTTSRLDGTVTDASGAVIPGATVVLTNTETGIERSSLTNDDGLYVFSQVNPGLYRVSAENAGFKKSVVEGVRVEVGVPATVSLRLEVGGTDEVVTVAAEQGQAVVNTVNASINTVVSRVQIENLPLPTRNVLDLALLQAGITGNVGRAARQASVNGTRGTFNNLTLDGINNQDTFIRTDSFFGIIPVKESFVEEFNITTSNSDVKGAFGSSQTQLITRSGTNEFHGSLFYFHKNDALNANTFFNNASGLPKERLLNHQFGGNVGGPILKNKLFFFVNYEEERAPASASIVRSVLTPSARQGNFTYIRRDNGQLQTVNLFQLGQVTPDAAMASIIQLTPLPNDTSTGDGRNFSGFRFNSPDTSNDRQWVAKVDFKPNQTHSIEGTFHRFTFDYPNDTGNDIGAVFPNLPGAGQDSTRYLSTAAWTMTPGPSFTNQVRYGFQWYEVDFFNNEQFSRGFKIFFPGEGVGANLIDNPVRNFAPQGRKAPVHEISNNASWITGNHSIDFGGSFRWTSVDLFNAAGVIPEYTLGFGTGNEDPLAASLFPGGISTNDLTSASEILAILGGFVDEAAQVFNVTNRTSGFVSGAAERRILRQKYFSFYGADTWKATPRLTLTLGLRWEYHGVPTEKDGLALLPRGGVSSVLDPNAVLEFAGSGTGRPFHKKDWNNFAPNVAIAWQPFGDNKTVFRAGYGISYVIDNNFTAVRNAFIANDGLSQEVAVSGLSGTVSRGGIVKVPTPVFKVPRTARDNILLDSQAALYTIDPDLRTPYVQQWTVGIQRELFAHTAVELRYVGNHGVKLGRAVDLNQVRFPAEFVEDFKRAQRNLAANNNPARGETLQVIPKLGLGGFLGNATIRSWIRNGEIGQYVGGFLAPNRAFFFAGEGGEDFGATLPISFFYPNPNAFVGDVLWNSAFSKYNALQFEVRRRSENGLSGLFNYTWSKVLTNFSGTQSNFRGLMDNAQPSLEIMRPEYDITHVLNGSASYDLPFGRGRRFMEAAPAVVDAVLGGWNLSGIMRIRSGEIVNIISNRGTINRGGARSVVNTAHLRNLDIEALQYMTGIFKDSRGRILLFHPSLIGPDGRANSNFFENPGLLQAGTLGLSPVSGPWYFTVDLGVRKQFRLPVTEDTRVEFRFDFFNLFNRTNFNVGRQGSDWESLGFFNNQDINRTTFGLIDSTFSSREMQVAIRILF